MTARTLVALKGYLNPQVAVFFGLGLASQAPINLIGGTLKFWFSELGLNLEYIGLFGLVLLPYALKFLWAPIIDHINLPLARWVGRKKVWGLITQLILMGLLILLSLAQPAYEIGYVFCLCMAIAFMASTQDIVIDALRIDTLSGDTLKEGSSAYQVGARLGMLSAVAGVIFLSSYLSWRTAYQLSTLLVAIGFVSLLFVKEKPPKTSRISFHQLIVAPFRDLRRRTHFWVLCVFIIAYKLCNGVLGPMAYPFYYNIGFTPAEVSLISATFGVFVTMTGIFCGSVLMLKYSYRNLLFYLGILEIFTSLAFAGLAAVGPSLCGFVIVILFDNLIGGIGGAVWVTYLSSLCNRSFSGTQYAFLAALNMVPMSVIASTSGWLAAHLGWIGFFLFTGVLMIPALVMIQLGVTEKVKKF